MYIHLFHKTLDDAQRYIEYDEFVKARKIILEHIAKEHHFQSEFNKLLGYLHNYDYSLRKVAGIFTMLDSAGELKPYEGKLKHMARENKEKIIDALVSASNSLEAARVSAEKLFVETRKK